VSERHAPFVLRAGVLGLLLLIDGVVAHTDGGPDSSRNTSLSFMGARLSRSLVVVVPLM
jgi:hypothetical protein